MEQIYSYSPEDIILSNLEETATRYFQVFEQELAHLSELAKELIENQSADSDLIPAIPEFHLSEHQVFHANKLSKEGDILQKLECIHIPQKQLLLSEAIRKQLKLQKTQIPSSFFSENEKMQSRAEQHIAYQKNSYADTAYLQFAPLLNAPRATYVHSFHSACEDVYNDVCDYCILPIENASEGNLVGFSKLIVRYGLKIVATCEVFGNEGMRSTRFALLRKNLFPLLCSKDLHDCRFGIAFSPKDTTEVSSILIAAELCELTISQINSIPQAEGMEGYCYHMSFDISKESNLSAFLIYLAMEHPEYTPIGIYKHITFLKK